MATWGVLKVLWEGSGVFHLKSYIRGGRVGTYMVICNLNGKREILYIAQTSTTRNEDPTPTYTFRSPLPRKSELWSFAGGELVLHDKLEIVNREYNKLDFLGVVFNIEVLETSLVTTIMPSQYWATQSLFKFEYSALCAKRGYYQLKITFL